MKIEDCFNFEYPITLNVQLKDKEQFIIFNNVCQYLKIKILYDVEIDDKEPLPIVKEHVELSVNDILADLNESKSK
jgi:hypothetical protein